MAEAALLVVGIDALPSGMVLDDVGDEERTSDHPRERSSRQALESVTHCHRNAAVAWARVAAQLGLLSAQPAPAPTPCGL